MKNLLYFVLGFTIVVTLMMSNYSKAAGCSTESTCILWGWQKVWITGVGVGSGNGTDSTWDLGSPCSAVTYTSGSNFNKYLGDYWEFKFSKKYWDTDSETWRPITAFSSSTRIEPQEPEYGQIVPYRTDGNYSQYTADLCAPQPCPEQGTVLEGITIIEGVYPDMACVEDCQYVEGGGLAMYVPSVPETLYEDMISTGENCSEGDNSSPGTNDTEQTGPTDENGDPPPYPIIELNDVWEPDQDRDGVASGNDEDVDGDGQENINDDDVDGDGTPNGSDNDVDGDGTSNGGRRGHWTYPSPISSDDGEDTGENENGEGADNDVDGDDVENYEDCDIDGDGWLNEEDGDIDGDGKTNSVDDDDDGDGVNDSADTDPQGANCSGGEAEPEDQEGGTGQTEGGDDSTPGEAEAEEEGEAPGEGDEVGTSSCPEGQVCIGDGICQTGEASYSSDCSGSAYYSERWDEFQASMKETDLFGTLDGIATLPTGGNSVQSIDLGELGGVQSFDWSEFNYIWSILSTLFLLAFSWIGIKIIVLKKD